jgi:hypothetical protein
MLVDSGEFVGNWECVVGREVVDRSRPVCDDHRFTEAHCFSGPEAEPFSSVQRHEAVTAIEQLGDLIIGELLINDDDVGAERVIVEEALYRDAHLGCQPIRGVEFDDEHSLGLAMGERPSEGVECSGGVLSKERTRRPGNGEENESVIRDGESGVAIAAGTIRWAVHDQGDLGYRLRSGMSERLAGE